MLHGYYLLSSVAVVAPMKQVSVDLTDLPVVELDKRIFPYLTERQVAL